MAAITRVITAIARWQCHRKRTGVGRRRSRCSTAEPCATEGLQFGHNCRLAITPLMTELRPLRPVMQSALVTALR